MPTHDASTRTWIDDEPGWAEVKLELACIATKARHRWLACLLIALVLAAGAVVWRWYTPSTYSGTVVLRVTEGSLELYSETDQSTTLATEIEQISLSRTAILEVMEEYDLDPLMRDLDPSFAASSMREDLEVATVQNYFSKQRGDEDPVRSARVSITYEHTDPVMAVMVARALSRRVIDQQMSSQERMAGLAVESASGVVAQLSRAITRAREQHVTTRMNAMSLGDEAASEEFVKAATLRAEIAQLEAAFKSAQAAHAGLGLKRAFALESMAMRFELIDEGEPQRVVLTHYEKVLLTGLIGFFVALAVAVLLVGTFDPRVYDVPSLKRLDLRLVGHIP